VKGWLAGASRHGSTTNLGESESACREGRLASDAPWCGYSILHCVGGCLQTNTRGEKVTDTKNPHWGSTLDDFLDEEGTREAFQAIAIKEVLSWQIAQAMKSQGISRKKLAERMSTSRSQVSRLLDPKDGNVTIVTLQRAAELLGRKVRLELI